MPRQVAENLKKIGFLTGKYMDVIISKMLENQSIEASELSKLMRSDTRRKRENFLIEHELIRQEYYQDNQNVQRKRLILTSKGKSVFRSLLDLESQI